MTHRKTLLQHPNFSWNQVRNALVVALFALIGASAPALAQSSPDLKAIWREKSTERSITPVKPVSRTTSAKKPRPVADAPKPDAPKPVVDAPKPASAPVTTKHADTSATHTAPAPDRLALLEQMVADQARLISSLTARVAAADSARRAVAPVPVKPDSQKVAKDTTAAPALKVVPPAAPHKAPDTTTASTAKAATPSATIATKPEAAAPALATRVDSLAAASKALEKQVTTMQQSFTQRLAGLGNFRFGGDIRVRGEAFNQGGGFVSRQRERTRARVTLTGSANDDLSGGIAISTGPLDDNQSPNQTNTGFFTRKVVGFDRFYLTYHPHQFKPLTITAGKFAYPWYRTSLTFGNDIYPEGVSQSLSFNFGKTNPLQNLTVVGFALPFNEVTAGSDGYISGGQVQTKWRLSPKAMGRVYATSLTMAHPDQIAAAVAGGTIKPSSVTNSLRTDSTGKVLGYATGFSYLEGIAAVDVAISPKFPLTLQLDVVSNARAKQDNTAWQLDARVGRLSEVKDIQLTWTLFNIERDAVLATFNEQDLRAGSNVRNDRIGLNYQFQKNMTLQFTGWFGRLLDPAKSRSLIPAGARASCTSTNTATCTDPLLRRLQFDVVYKY